MKRFIVRLFYFLSPLLIIVICCEFRLRTINSFYKQKIEGLHAKRREIQILILGNSHTAFACNTKYFSVPSYNMAFGYQPLFYDERILDKELPYLPRLKYVIIDVSYHIFYIEDAFDRDFFYKYYYDIDPPVRQSFSKKYLSQFLFVYDPTTAFQVMFSNNKTLYNGFGGLDTTLISNFNDSAGKDKMEKWSDLAKNAGNSFASNREILEHIIVELQKRSIMPVLVSTPLSRFCNKYDNPKISERNHKLINELINQYDILYYDLQSISLIKDEDFCDVDHLKTGGSVKFTKFLDSLIIRDSAYKNHLISRWSKFDRYCF